MISNEKSANSDDFLLLLFFTIMTIYDKFNTCPLVNAFESKHKLSEHQLKVSF